MQIATPTRLKRVLTTFVSHAERQREETKEWRAMKPLARLQALEVMRRLNHPDYDPSSSRLQRLYSAPTERRESLK